MVVLYHPKKATIGLVHRWPDWGIEVGTEITLEIPLSSYIWRLAGGYTLRQDGCDAQRCYATVIAKELQLCESSCWGDFNILFTPLSLAEMDLELGEYTHNNVHRGPVPEYLKSVPEEDRLRKLRKLEERLAQKDNEW